MSILSDQAAIQIPIWTYFGNIPKLSGQQSELSRNKHRNSQFTSHSRSDSYFGPFPLNTSLIPSHILLGCSSSRPQYPERSHYTVQSRCLFWRPCMCIAWNWPFEDHMIQNASCSSKAHTSYRPTHHPRSSWFREDEPRSKFRVFLCSARESGPANPFSAIQGK